MSKKKFVQKLCATEVSDFSSNSHRFRTKIEIFQYFTQIISSVTTLVLIIYQTDSIGNLFDQTEQILLVIVQSSLFNRLVASIRSAAPPLFLSFLFELLPLVHSSL